MSHKICSICGNTHFAKLKTYKHDAYVCANCGTVEHVKKRKYFLEYLVPRSLAQKLLPHKAFLRLFSDRGEFKADDFYNSTSFDSTNNVAWRVSEVSQVKDQLKLMNIELPGKRILDISGGPGNIGKYLKDEGAEVIVTEYSADEVGAMKNKLGIQALRFDYSSNNIKEIVPGKFDLIMIRSSIIFCENIEKFFDQISTMLTEDGHLFLETITPSLGEILWWQQLEYKFPRIYSEATITNLIEKLGLSLVVSYTDCGSYNGVKFRSYNTFMRQLFTWCIDYPMVQIYRLLNLFESANLDKSLNHKMLTQIWSKKQNSILMRREFIQGAEHKSKTFGYKYNGYLKDLKKISR